MKIGNTLTRIIVAILAIPFLVGVCYIGEFYFLIFVAGVGLISFYELGLMLKNKKTYINLPVGLTAVLMIIVNSYFSFLKFYQITLIIILVLTLYELFRNNESAIHNIGSTLFGILYLGVFPSTIIGLREYFYGGNYLIGGYFIISILVTIWVCDSAAFFIGTAIGKHKLFPRVSPNKSWEGAIAGFVFSVAAMAIAKIVILDIFSWTDTILIGILIGIFGQVGDLIESLIKRDAGVKDSSSIIPGHGGVFDRFDSLLFIAPVIYLYIDLFL